MDSEIWAWERCGSWAEDRLERLFCSWGAFTTRHPALVAIAGLLPAVCCSLGLLHVQFTTDPVELWSSPGSPNRLQKDYFDNHFGPFYRTEQLIIVPKNQSLWTRVNWAKGTEEVWGPVFLKPFLYEVLELQNRLASLKAETAEGNVTLDDICFQPLYPNNRNCTIQSPLNWFQNSKQALDYTIETDFGDTLDYLDHIMSCVFGPTQVNDTNLHTSCLGSYGGPIMPFIALGGYNATNYTQATAVVITFVVNNHVNKAENWKAEAWESEFIKALKAYKSPNLTIYYNSERSIQDEIKRESESDAFTVAISYFFMFGYIVFALGQYNVYRNNLGYLLILLGLLGVLIVGLSVAASIGVYAFAGIPATMIILEVQPFLVLAVGVDNIFIFVQAYQRDLAGKERSLEERIGRISGEVIPSMLLSSSAEALCFFLGAMSSMPAVRTFSLYAALAIAFDFFLQITCFLAVFTLDLRRQESGRMEPFCWPRLEPQTSDSEGFLFAIFRDYYTPFVTSKPVRYAVVLLFAAWLGSSLAVVDKIELGLDQSLSMPEDSYVLRYFTALTQYLSVGPPVYFVVKGKYDYADNVSQNLLCGGSGCDPYSLGTQISQAAAWKNRSYIAQPVSNWLDDYIDWLRPSKENACCRVRDKDNTTFCPATDKNHSCHSCVNKYEYGRPSEQAFDKYLDDFLHDNPNINCAKGGHAAYFHALSFTGNYGHSPIEASYFMTYHTVLKTSADYIAALENADRISQNIQETLNANRTDGDDVEVFPYSIFYVFYEQYLTLAKDAALQLSMSIIAIFFVTTLLLGLDPWSAIVTTVTIAMILLNLMGLMHWWNISFNAVSLVNLVMAVGISVEFCAHIVRAFAASVRPTRVERAREALSTMGSSVLSGITLTKFGGIVVLAFSHSQIFQVFYFRMYLGIVIIGALHGLVFLPVFLSFLGPSLNKRKLQRKQLEGELLANQTVPTPRSQEALVGQLGARYGDGSGSDASLNPQYEEEEEEDS